MKAVTFANESEFEAYVRELIRSRITAHDPQTYALDSKKAVDILICRDGPNPQLYFLEIKFHRASHGRLGFGGGAGRGFQPELLTRRPAYFDLNLRWVLASELHEPDKVLFLDSSDVCEYVSGGAIGQKFNNFQQRIWREASWLTHDQFADELALWLMPRMQVTQS